eukprot:scaffold236_cov228-Pinguiococcus_pyrenoidosus.AAC.1
MPPTPETSAARSNLGLTFVPSSSLEQDWLGSLCSLAFSLSLSPSLPRSTGFSSRHPRSALVVLACFQDSPPRKDRLSVSALCSFVRSDAQN